MVGGWVVVAAVVAAVMAAAARGSPQSFLSHVMSGLSELPVIGNVVRASVHPIYRPFVRRLQQGIASRECVSDCVGERIAAAPFMKLRCVQMAW